MARRRLPGPYNCVQALARALGWFTAVAAVVVLAYIVNEWPDEGRTVSAGLAGACIALLNDSWECIALAGHPRGLSLAPIRSLLCDVVALAMCLSGILMILFSNLAYDIYGEHHQWSDTGVFSQTRLMRAAMWLLTALVIWRFLFSFWTCWDCSRNYRRAERRWREAQMEDA